MESVDCGVREEKNMLCYDRSSSELASLKKKDFSFDINPHDDRNAVGVFEAKKNGEVVRRNISQPFPAGSLSKKDMDVNAKNCNVTLKKHDPNIKLRDFFEC